jgi:hypothetical protein
LLSDAIIACGAATYTSKGSLNSLHARASDGLREKLKRSDRDSSLCALVSVILCVTELMVCKTEELKDTMKVSRTLIKECLWNAQSDGVGAACFWLNVTMETLSCLQSNRQLAWDPENWGFDTEVYERNETEGGGLEDFWVRGAVYILAKVINFRAAHAVNEEIDEPRHTHDVQVQEVLAESKQQVERRRDEARATFSVKLGQYEPFVNNRLRQWDELSKMCREWVSNIPPTMQPVGFLPGEKTASKSNFPEIW